MTKNKKHVETIDLIDEKYHGMTLQRFIQALSEIEIPDGQEAIIDVKEDYEGWILIEFYQELTEEEKIEQKKEARIRELYNEVSQLKELLTLTHSTINWQVVPEKSMYKEALTQLYAVSEQVSNLLFGMYLIDTKEQIQHFENLDRVITERERSVAKLEEIMKND